jgi:hypothetical protein
MLALTAAASTSNLTPGSTVWGGSGDPFVSRQSPPFIRRVFGWESPVRPTGRFRRPALPFSRVHAQVRVAANVKPLGISPIYSRL